MLIGGRVDLMSTTLNKAGSRAASKQNSDIPLSKTKKNKFKNKEFVLRHTKMERAAGYVGNLTPEQNKVLNDFKSSLSRRFSSPTYDEIPVSPFELEKELIISKFKF